MSTHYLNGIHSLFSLFMLCNSMGKKERTEARLVIFGIVANEERIVLQELCYRLCNC